MPLPPILEIFVVWHPDDEIGSFVAETLMGHFHRSAFSGLAGGAVEVYVRSKGWHRPDGPPRPMAFDPELPPHLSSAEHTVVVPVIGAGLAQAVQDNRDWLTFIQGTFSADHTGKVSVFPLRDEAAHISGSMLEEMVGVPHFLPKECLKDAAMLCREVSQAIAQRLDANSARPRRIKVFISHTKHHSPEEQDRMKRSSSRSENKARVEKLPAPLQEQLDEQDDVGPRLFDLVRGVIANTRLAAFFDAADLQPGMDWEAEFEAESAHHALLMLRTDLYSRRDWTQREVLMAKKHDLPVVTLQALRAGEEQGSFLMDHVPTIPFSYKDPTAAITMALNRIVDETLKRSLWRAQTVYLRKDGFDWLPVHAPEPVTLGPWLRRHREEQPDDQHVWVIHPDPPLGPKEHEVIVDLCQLAGYTQDADVLTPRTFAARGGKLRS